MAEKEKGAHACKGQNACKGQGGCKSGDQGCKGKNSCKGKGGCAVKGSAFTYGGTPLARAWQFKDYKDRRPWRILSPA